jgi:hypothetical protein
MVARSPGSYHRMDLMVFYLSHYPKQVELVNYQTCLGTCEFRGLMVRHFRRPRVLNTFIRIPFWTSNFMEVPHMQDLARPLDTFGFDKSLGPRIKYCRTATARSPQDLATGYIDFAPNGEIKFSSGKRCQSLRIIQPRSSPHAERRLHTTVQSLRAA